MSVIDNARALLPENHNGWDCDGSASICDERVQALRDLLAEHGRLTAWKAEAITVLSEWEETWQAAGRPGRLGSSKAIAVRELIERLTAPPTDDEQEAMANLLGADQDDRGRDAPVFAGTALHPRQAYAIADAILASGVWRNRRGPITDEITDRQIERGARALVGDAMTDEEWEQEKTESHMTGYWDASLAVLEAAEGAR